MNLIRKMVIAGSWCLVAACGQETAPTSQAIATEAAVTSPSIGAVKVEHGETPLDFIVSWQAEVPVNIYVAEAPQTPMDELQLLAENATGGSFQWQADAPAKRRYFSVKASTADEVVNAAVRLLPLEGGRNFRDLGGYPTADGKSVKWGKVYRSGVMAGLTDQDYAYLSSLGISTVCDYRSAGERTDEPTQWRAGEIEYVTFPDPATETGSSFMSVLQKPQATPQMVADAMALGYAQIAKQHSAAYTYMFDQLAAGNTPLAFNCSAGKDRAGISAALLLTALGVPREYVVKDYALSEQVVDYMQEFLSDTSADQNDEESPYAYLSRLPRELVAPLMRSDPLYIETALNDLAAEYGSVMSFIQTELDVTDAELRTIRAALLH